MKFLALVLVGILGAGSNESVRVVVTLFTFQIITVIFFRCWVLNVIGLGSNEVRLDWGKSLDG